MRVNKLITFILSIAILSGLAHAAMPKQDYAAFEKALIDYQQFIAGQRKALKVDVQGIDKRKRAVKAIYNNLKTYDQLLALSAIEDSGLSLKDFDAQPAQITVRKKAPTEPHSMPAVHAQRAYQNPGGAQASRAKATPVHAAVAQTQKPSAAPKAMGAKPAASVKPAPKPTAKPVAVVSAPTKSDVLARFIKDPQIRNALKKQGLEKTYVDLIVAQQKVGTDDQTIQRLVDMNLRNDRLTVQGNACAAAAPAVKPRGGAIPHAVQPKPQAIARHGYAQQKALLEVVMLNAREAGDGKHTWDCSWEILNNAFAIVDALKKNQRVAIDISKVPYQNWVPQRGFDNPDSEQMEKLIRERNLFAPHSYTFLEGDPQEITAEILEALGTDMKSIKNIKHANNAIHIFFVNKSAHWIAVVVHKLGNKITYYIADDIRSKRKPAINAGVVSLNDLQRSDYHDVIALIRNLIEK